MDIFLTLASLLGGSIVSNTRESGTPSNDGEGSGTYTRAYDTESKVPCNINLLTSFNHFHFRINGNILNSAFERQTIFISLMFKVFFGRDKVLGFTMLSSIFICFQSVTLHI